MLFISDFEDQNDQRMSSIQEQTNSLQAVAVELGRRKDNSGG